MPAPHLTANYRRDGDDWVVTVRSDARSLEARAPGLIAARVRADQLVDELAGGRRNRTVVHMLDGDAFAFSVVYLHTRHGLAVPPSRTPDASTPHDQVIEA
ncbi:hypothetical protein ABZ816_29505 [Actinosynnema sp. NPDC047251]|uniref:Uncharacterized protein n=1 Tax=Saccharothrix espanaensis (strain ATCC 51144 / DSM 44229 / JCM 9112 / NBRC 15066 / NRRL 15764) TaxID=1179773 RepID=K0JPD8_SACES|nr:hypothetical protein [Saccharothrix espanaensis]CCH28525.1 hypothetical protein BN6_11990 [Saccharothrix espanaensis DSM 44229]